MVVKVNGKTEFHYDPQRGSFKGWLLQLTRWKIIDQKRKRGNLQIIGGVHDQIDTCAETELFWDEQWKSHVATAALSRVRKKASPWMFQIFHACVIGGKGPKETARILCISRATVYMANFKVGRMLRAEAVNIEKAELRIGSAARNQLRGPTVFTVNV